MTWTELEDCLHDLVIELTGKAAIWEKQNAPRPKKPYLSMRLFSLREIGRDEQRQTATPGEVLITGPREVTLTVQWYGAGAEDGLRTIAQALQRPTVIDRCQAMNIAICPAGGVQDVGSLLEAAWEERAALDFTVRFTQDVIDKPGYIHSVEINGDIKPPAGNKPLANTGVIDTVVINTKLTVGGKT